MNQSMYGQVYNPALGIIQVVAGELTKARGKSGRSSAKRRAKLRMKPLHLAVAMALGLGGITLPCSALAVTGTAGGNGGSPTGGTGTGSGVYANSGGTGTASGQGADGSGGGAGTCSAGAVAASYGGGSGGKHICNGGGARGGSLKTGGYGGGGGGGNGGTGGGGGGGGGAPAATFTTTQTISGTYIGGQGGKGGPLSDPLFGFDGGGGGGGAGAILNSGITLTNNGTITGGAGGNGVAGGGGGAGLLLLTGSTLYNTGSITGGNGAISSVNAGAIYTGGGGSGLAADGNTTIVNSGSIVGGRANGGASTRANAIDFYNGGNTLELLAGSTITGNVVSNGGGDTLALGGTTNSSFDIGTVGAALQYRGFQTLAQIGSATWTITGSNTSGLGWSLNGGTLSISSATGTELGSYTVTFNGGILQTTAAATLSQNMALAGNGSFDNGGNADTLSGIISGTGAMNFLGTGTTTLTGTNTYTGGTTVSVGTLQSGAVGAFADNTAYTVNGGTLDLNGNALTMSALSGTGGGISLGAAALTVNQSSSTTYAGAISGTGSLTKSGTGTLILNGTNTYTGTTTISSGTLEVGDATHSGATIASNVTVGSGGILRGHGTINGNVSNGGTVAPGGSIGVLSINGNYTQSAAGTLTIGVMPTATTTAIAGTDNDQLNVSGTASLAGALAVTVNAGTYTMGTQYNIVHAGTAVSGTFNSVAYNQAFASYITPQLSYGASDVFLTLNPTTAAFTSGQGTSIGDWSSMQALMSSEQTVLNVQGGTAGAILKVNGRPDPAVWVRGTIGTGGAYGANLDNNSLLVGGGDEIRPGLIIGAALGSTSTRTSTTQDQVKTRSTGLYLYTLYNDGPLFVDATATAGSMNTDSVRSLPPTTLVATGSASGSYAGISGRVGYRITKGNAFVTPYVGAGYLHTRRGGYTETGAGILNLSYAAMNYDIGTLSAGARVGADVEQASGMVVSPWVELGGIVYTGNRNQGQTVTLGSVQQVLPATGAPASAATLNAGLALMSQGNWSAQFVYHGEYSQNSHMNTADVKAVYRW